MFMMVLSKHTIVLTCLSTSLSRQRTTDLLLRRHYQFFQCLSSYPLVITWKWLLQFSVSMKRWFVSVVFTRRLIPASVAKTWLYSLIHVFNRLYRCNYTHSASILWKYSASCFFISNNHELIINKTAAIDFCMFAIPQPNNQLKNHAREELKQLL